MNTPPPKSPAIPTPHHPKHVEIDNRTLKLVVGVIAIALPVLTALYTQAQILSISESYYFTGPASTIFVGFLFAIAAFLFAYNGRTKYQMFWSKIAGLAAASIALFPCDCSRADGPGVHYVAAGVMFGVLAYFCWAFYTYSFTSGYKQAKARRAVYLVCGIAILAAIFVLVANAVFKLDQQRFTNLVFWGEAAGLWAFGISWLVASRTVPVLTHPNERFSPLRPNNPPD